MVDAGAFFVVIPEFREAKYPGPRVSSGENSGPLGPGSRAPRLAGMTALARMTVCFVVLVLSLSSAWAVQPDEILKDPVLEARARHISQELRCLVCQNQSIDDSNAELARDLRVIVRERLTAGDTNSQVLAFVERRYGEFVLLRPRLAPHTLLLWLTPLLLLVAVAAVLYRRVRTGVAARVVPAPLSPAEQRRLDELIGKES